MHFVVISLAVSSNSFSRIFFFCRNRADAAELRRFRSISSSTDSSDNFEATVAADTGRTGVEILSLALSASLAGAMALGTWPNGTTEAPVHGIDALGVPGI
jgi:hypothetical protein